MRLKVKYLILLTELLLVLLLLEPSVSSLVSKSDIANFVNKTDFDNKVEDVISIINELNELAKKVKAISIKRLTEYLIDRLVFLMEQNIFLQEYFRII